MSRKIGENRSFFKVERGRKLKENFILPNYKKYNENVQSTNEKEKRIEKLPSVHKNKKIEGTTFKLFRS